MKKYFMSVDGGGSKIITILFDQDLHFCGCGKSGAINPRFVSNWVINNHFTQCIDQCLQGGTPESIETMYIAMPGPIEEFNQLLSRRVKLNQIQCLSEGEMCLLAGIFEQRGIVALSGTGSGIFYVNGKNSSHLGGMGALFDDEGSGYSIGQAALSAVVKSIQKRTSYTQLEEMTARYWQLDGLLQLIDKVYASDDYRGLIANLVVPVIDTANAGDNTAKKILQRAGSDMAKQVIALIQRDRIQLSCPIMVAGSVWKNNILMFEAFRSKLHRKYPGLSVVTPAFEAVMGGVFKSILDRNEQIDQRIVKQIRQNYPDYIYNGGISISSHHQC